MMLSPTIIPGKYYKTLLFGDEPVIENPCDTPDPVTGDRSEACLATWNGAEYYNWLLYLKGRLSDDEFEQFNQSFLAWKGLNKESWRYGNKWQDFATGLICDIDETF